MPGLFIYSIIMISVLSRLIDHPANFAPITALAIFSAVYLSKKQAVAIPLAARLVSDIFLGFYQWPLMVAVYGSHVAGVLFGLWIKKETAVSKQWAKIIVSSLSSSLLFFLVTNFAFLYSNYSHTWAGITTSYINALPFFRGTLVGDIVWSAVLFGAAHAVKYFYARGIGKKAYA